MNTFQHSMRYRTLKHGSEEEYVLFEDLAVCQARNRRMHSAAESRLHLYIFSPEAAPGEATTQQTTVSDEHPEVEDLSSCSAGHGKQSQEKDDTNDMDLNTTTKTNEPINEVSLVEAHPHSSDEHHVCKEDDLQPLLASDDQSSDHHDAPSEVLCTSKEAGEEENEASHLRPAMTSLCNQEQLPVNVLGSSDPDEQLVDN